LNEAINTVLLVERNQGSPHLGDAIERESIVDALTSRYSCDCDFPAGIQTGMKYVLAVFGHEWK
jgi:hypothetical protein